MNIDKIVKWLRIVKLLEALEATQNDSENLKIVRNDLKRLRKS